METKKMLLWEMDSENGLVVEHPEDVELRIFLDHNEVAIDGVTVEDLEALNQKLKEYGKPIKETDEEDTYVSMVEAMEKFLEWAGFDQAEAYCPDFDNGNEIGVITYHPDNGYFDEIDDSVDGLIKVYEDNYIDPYNAGEYELEVLEEPLYLEGFRTDDTHEFIGDSCVYDIVNLDGDSVADKYLLVTDGFGGGGRILEQKDLEIELHKMGLDVAEVMDELGE